MFLVKTLPPNRPSFPSSSLGTRGGAATIIPAFGRMQGPCQSAVHCRHICAVTRRTILHGLEQNGNFPRAGSRSHAGAWEPGPFRRQGIPQPNAAWRLGCVERGKFLADRIPFVPSPHPFAITDRSVFPRLHARPMAGRLERASGFHCFARQHDAFGELARLVAQRLRGVYG
jgi:hypothetical protein